MNGGEAMATATASHGEKLPVLMKIGYGFGDFANQFVYTTIDFAAVGLLLSGGKVAGARVCMNAVSVTPRRARESGEALRGQPVNEETAEKAGAAAVAGGKPLEHNRYIVQIARTMVKRAMLACGE
jgi:CO/xanthine dehydrogenase FAD-binding subunit